MTVYEATGWEALAASSGWAVVLITLAIAGVLAAVLYGLRESRLVPRGWGLLLALRLLAIGAAAVLLAGVERRVMTETEQPSRVVLLSDQSASMQLSVNQESSNPASRQEAANVALDRAAKLLAANQTIRRARFDVAVKYPADDETLVVEPGGSTRIGSALQRVLADHTTTPLAAIILASDGGWNAGPEPAAAVATAVRRGVPIHTLGVGPLTQPPSVGLRDLAAPGRASAGDRFRATVSVAANAEAQASGAHQVTVALQALGEGDTPGAIVFEKQVEVAIGPEGGLAAANLDIEGMAPGNYELIATLQPAGKDSDPSDNRRVTRVELVDKPTRVLLAAGGPARDYRFLRDQLFRDELFACDVLLQSAGGAVTQDAGKVLTTLPADAAAWEAYDVVVAIDLDWGLVDEATQEALAEWVASRGGGLVLVAGPVYTPSAVRRGFAPPLRTLLPVTLRDDPLALNAAIEANRDPQPIKLTPAGEDVDFLRPPTREGVPDQWSQFEGVYGMPLPAETKPGATLLATLDVGGDEATPFCVEHFYGAGRVIYLATAETWRLRRVDPAWFTSLQTGLLRHVSQGRLLGGAAEGTLLTDRDRYDLGEPITIRYVARSPETIGAEGPGFVRLIAPGNQSAELPLASVEGQAGVFAASVRGSAVGRYDAIFFTPAGQRLTASAEVTLPSLESETVVQNVELLKSIANTSGGRYIDLADPKADELIAQIAADTPSLAETTIDLGPPDAEFAEWIAQVSLGVMASALLLEWLLRRSWRLA